MSLGDWTSGEPRLLVRTCGSCGARSYLPHRTCPRCHSGVLAAEPGSGRGTCVATTRVHLGAGNPEPYALVLVELVEGCTMMARATDRVCPGDPVRVAFEEVDDRLLPVFDRED